GDLGFRSRTPLGTHAEPWSPTRDPRDAPGALVAQSTLLRFPAPPGAACAGPIARAWPGDPGGESYVRDRSHDPPGGMLARVWLPDGAGVLQLLGLPPYLPGRRLHPRPSRRPRPRCHPRRAAGLGRGPGRADLPRRADPSEVRPRVRRGEARRGVHRAARA